MAEQLQTEFQTEAEATECLARLRYVMEGSPAVWHHVTDRDCKAYLSNVRGMWQVTIRGVP